MYSYTNTTAPKYSHLTGIYNSMYSDQLVYLVLSPLIKERVSVSVCNANKLPLFGGVFATP